MNKAEKNSIEQFNKWAYTYDKKHFLPFYFSNRFILGFMNLKNEDSILDIGCGTGILIKQLSNLNMNLNLHGIDIAAKMVITAKKKLSDQRVLIPIASSSSIPYDDESFDFITCATSFHHYSKPEKSLKEMFRVLKVKGKVFLLDPFTDGIFRKIICLTLNMVYNEKDTNLYSSEEMRSMFSEAGFKNITQKSHLKYKLLTIGSKI